MNKRIEGIRIRYHHSDDSTMWINLSHGSRYKVQGIINAVWPRMSLFICVFNPKSPTNASISPTLHSIVKRRAKDMNKCKNDIIRQKEEARTNLSNFTLIFFWAWVKEALNCWPNVGNPFTRLVMHVPVSYVLLEFSSSSKFYFISL